MKRHLLILNNFNSQTKQEKHFCGHLSASPDLCKILPLWQHLLGQAITQPTELVYLDITVRSLHLKDGSFHSHLNFT